MGRLKDKKGIELRSIHWALLLGLVALMGALTIHNLSTQSKDNIVTDSQVEEEYPIDDENDGVYTNYKYGFKFEYPKNIFVIQRNNRTGVSWVTEESVDEFGPSLPRDEQMILKVNIMEQDESYPWPDSFGQNYHKRENEELISYKVNAVKVKNVDVDGVQGYVAKLYTDYGPEGDVSYVNGYSAVWQKNNIIFTLSLNVSEKDEIQKRERLFDSILETVEFTELRIQ